ncbi:PEP-CTERM sorting domain-containing protein [Paucibacter sediminis]|uniref:PEP-CTERM sorting domain-containing protein n=1 Tax=Paucibacter sediminis TaxID=3019553 RepID=A0AA95NEG5_9BURK|nr:PEP-CTERM sorting domain-containing protein [Paucibacter sp. S2-9]WIT11357.1 PEP-CTERM sorting domain-containing protein [Paucibacter sp. S2-9]
MSKLSTTIKALVAAAAVVGATAASATPIVGSANFSFGFVKVTVGNIDWNPSINPPPNVVKTYGTFFTSGGGNSGSFAAGAMAGLTTGEVQDMSSFPIPDANNVPIGFGLTTDFLKFAAQPGWSFDVRWLAAGNIAGAPYFLTQLGDNVSATISMNGIACDTGGDSVCDATDDKTQWTGIFSAQYTNTTIAAMQAALLGPDGIPFTGDDGALDNNTWSATIEARAIPEPATLGLVGLALAGLGLTARRRKAA